MAKKTTKKPSKRKHQIGDLYWVGSKLYEVIDRKGNVEEVKEYGSSKMVDFNPYTPKPGSITHPDGHVEYFDSDGKHIESQKQTDAKRLDEAFKLAREWVKNQDDLVNSLDNCDPSPASYEKHKIDWSAVNLGTENQKQPPKPDMVNKPPHYNQGKIEVIDFILDQNMNYLAGNVTKYISRYRFKNGVEDLKKARFYLDQLIKQEEDKKNGND